MTQQKKFVQAEVLSVDISIYVRYKFPSKSQTLFNKMIQKQMFKDENYDGQTTANSQNDQGCKYKVKQIKPQQMGNDHLQK